MTMPIPTNPDKKTAISIKLPPHLIEWLDRQPESRPELIEKALCEYMTMPKHLRATQKE